MNYNNITSKREKKASDSSYTLEIVFYSIMFVLETLFIRFGIGVESWFASIILAVTLGSLCTWAITYIPDLLE